MSRHQRSTPEPGNRGQVRKQENIDVRIEELVVEGLRRSEVIQFQRAVERELVRLIQERGLPGGRSSTRSVVEVEDDRHANTHRNRAHPTANYVASAIYRAVTE